MGIATMPHRCVHLAPGGQEDDAEDDGEHVVVDPTRLQGADALAEEDCAARHRVHHPVHHVAVEPGDGGGEHLHQLSVGEHPHPVHGPVADEVTDWRQGGLQTLPGAAHVDLPGHADAAERQQDADAPDRREVGNAEVHLVVGAREHDEMAARVPQEHRPEGQRREGDHHGPPALMSVRSLLR